MSRDRDDRDEKPRLSWSEIDKRRDRPRSRSESERRPRGPAAQARSQAATQQYLRKRGEELFAREAGGAKAEPLAAAIRSAHGTPKLGEACRAYLDAIGSPRDASLASLFLDADDPRLILAGLESIEALRADGKLSASPGLRTQLRILAENPDDDVADAAEELLAKL